MHIKILEVFDMGELVKLHCGARDSNGEIIFEATEGEIEDYGVEECKKFMKSISGMASLKKFGINLDPRLR